MISNLNHIPSAQAGVRHALSGAAPAARPARLGRLLDALGALRDSLAHDQFNLAAGAVFSLGAGAAAGVPQPATRA